MKLLLPAWTVNQNMIIFSLLCYCEREKIDLKVGFDATIPIAGAILQVDGKSVFFDYSDNTTFLENPQKYTVYLKRSLLEADRKANIHPLNFQMNYSYKALQFLNKIPVADLLDKRNRVEIFRALDHFTLFTSSHQSMDVRNFPTEPRDSNGKVIYYTRLWHLSNTKDEEEKERRFRQNEFRINACRIIRDNFENASAGLFADEKTAIEAPDLLLPSNKTDRLSYFRQLRHFDIGVADDGLKDTPGYKIGEYILFGMAVISTPITTIAENFDEGKNYLKLSSRSAYEEIPEKINSLLQDKNYLEMAANNREWGRNYLYPDAYASRFMEIIRNFQ